MADLNAALQEQQAQARLVHLGELMLQRGLASKGDLTSALMEVAGIPYFDCTSAQIEPQILQLIPGAMARRCHALPVWFDGAELVVALAEPQNLRSVDELRFKTGKAIAPRLAFRSEIDVAIAKYYGPGEELVSAPGPATAPGDEDRTIEFISSSEHVLPLLRGASNCRSGGQAATLFPGRPKRGERMSRNHNHRRDGRLATRVHTVERISVNYEGRTEEVADRLPDVSPQGMFINTSQKFPEGAVLNLNFRLALSGAEIQTRCEVRYCQQGEGVGVELGSRRKQRGGLRQRLSCASIPKNHDDNIERPAAQEQEKLTLTDSPAAGAE